MKNYDCRPMRGYNTIKGFTVKDKHGKPIFTTNNYSVARRAAAIHKGAYVSYYKA